MKKGKLGLAILLLLLGGVLSIYLTHATPVGSSITSNTTEQRPAASPASLNNSRSTINTLVLNAIQIDQHWKAYVGNVTGLLTLDDAANFTIYDWTLSTITGEVYATRTGSADFSSVQCVTDGVRTTEETTMNMTAGDADSITSTFAFDNHTSTTVAGTVLTGCNSTTLYVNDTSQGGDNATADFHEFLMQDNAANLVYVSIINDNTVGFDNNNYDFQMIVAESDVQTSSVYYFYVELG